MRLSSLALRYVPFLLFMLIGLVVAFDARIRLRRPVGSRWVPITQLVLGLAQALCCVVAITIAPDVGLFDPGALPLSTSTTTAVYLAAGLLAIPTLVAGLIRPADPDPRRGFTVLALVLDVVATAGCAYALFGPSAA